VAVFVFHWAFLALTALLVMHVQARKQHVSLQPPTAGNAQ
jgi:hypothetical protein